MSTIFVLGGGGFLGGKIAAQYRALGWRVVSVGRSSVPESAHAAHLWDLPHPEFGDLLAREAPDLCVNAAGLAAVPVSIVDPRADFEGSTVLTFRTLDDVRRFSPQTKYIHISSAAVYGQPLSLPVGEDGAVTPISPYGWHKRLSEMVLEEFSAQYGMRSASLRVFSAYGLGLRRQVVWDIVQRAVAQGKGPLVLHGSAADSRDFVHGSDVALAVQTVAQHGVLGGECYNVASGEETRIRDLAAAVLHLLGLEGEIVCDGVRKSGVPSRWHADIRRLETLGYRPRVTLEQGIRELIETTRAGA